MKFEIVEEKGNKLIIEYDEVFEDTICAVMNWDKLTEFRLQYFISEALYNYIDKPDLNMNELVSFTRNTLFNKNNVGIRLPAFIGFILVLKGLTKW